ncbi:hypothetical protein [Scytonema sp. PCC 10023]|uniref:hypothetical protein n=1 Tax=Scytonema sp. PCC 10023 TaxID=1680591 RepID=UPI0039C5D084
MVSVKAGKIIIIEYLEECYPQPALLPIHTLVHTLARAYVRQIALLVACQGSLVERQAHA